MSLDSRRDGAGPAAEAQKASLPDTQTLRTYVVEHLGEAVEKGWVVPFYQPVVRTLTGELCGFEALARWDDPQFGLLGPEVFIDALEEARVVHLLDSHIVSEVCRHQRMCLDANYPIVPVSMNFSRLDFDLCDIFQVVEDAVHDYEVPRGMVNIEITETVFGTDPAYMAMMVRRFHDVGYQVWMDDFGSGYSTLNALKDFDFDELKIDMAFLNRFGEKSKTILASVVDMAKKLGIQTLAEGVETEEHRDYLRRIGCEKMQGYLYGRPAPFSPDMMLGYEKSIGVESASDRRYMTAIGSVNTLSLSERDLTAGSTMQGYVTSMPLAIVEYDGEAFSIIDSNRVFREGLANVGIDSIEEAERRINDQRNLVARTSLRLIDTIEQDRYARIDYVVGGIGCVMRARYITTEGKKKAVLVSIDDTIEQGERKRHDRMVDALGVLYSIYEHVDIIHLDECYIEEVFSTIGFHAQFDAPTFDEATEYFARTEVYPRDQERYRAFMDHATMVERIRDSGENYIVGFFRMRHHGGDYAWKLVGLIHLPKHEDSQVLYCVRGTHWSNDALFQEAFDGYDDDGRRDLTTADMRLTDGSLWRAISRDDSVGYFWKDRERRFVGANQKFLDYYGFSSVEDIVGRTDEDMGWHIDPRPFMDDELRVLNEGYITSDVPGQCIVRGEVRDILASKRPVYRNGRIVGLVGHFVDVADRQSVHGDLERLPLVDSVTGLLNFTGLEAATMRFIDAYTKLGLDFAMISVNFENYHQINYDMGYDFGDKVLLRIADELRDVAGSRCAVGHVHSRRFVILAQGFGDDELQAMCDDVEERVARITSIDGTPCTVFALASFARFSDYNDIEEMKRANRSSRVFRRANW